EISDGHGEGVEIIVSNEEDGLPTIEQIYHVYEGLPYFVTSIEVSDATTIYTNDIAPIVMNTVGGIDLGVYDDNRVLLVPYDNESRNGLIMGSITHDTWKTGITWSGSNDRLDKLKVFGGFALEELTRDTLPHGEVTGTTIQSPQIFVGFYDDYRDGMEGYG